MKIQHLLYEFIQDRVLIDHLDHLNIEVKGLTLNSKKVARGDLFFAVKGQVQDGRVHLQEAIERKACALVVERENMSQFPICFNAPIPVIPIDQLQEKISEIASRYYGDPSHDLTVIGITGTNGKTTTAHILATVLTSLGEPCGMIGTLGCQFGDYIVDADSLTTPDAITLQAQLADLKARGAKSVVMEVSSHGLDQSRVQGIQFDSAIFTNLTQDHLDYHGTMEVYGAAKQKLFHFPSLRRMIINADDGFSMALLKGLPTPKICPTLLYTRQPNLPVEIQNFPDKPRICLELTTQSVEFNTQGHLAALSTPWGEVVLRSRLMGDFNVSNLLCVLAELGFQGIPLDEAVKAIGRASAPPGRLQRFGGATVPLILVDYAHTPDALYNALQVARFHCARRLWCVFGCGGERDKLKRSQMGHIAATMADKVVITNDNPRHEHPKDIIKDILKGIAPEYGENITVDEDREQAIAYAIDHALAHDVILIAGKGHESYQQIGDHRFVFSDAVCVQKYLGENIHEIR